MSVPKFIINEDGFTEISDECVNCKFSYIEDIWHEWCCKKNKCPHEIKEENE